MPATDIAGILAAPGSCTRPSRAVPPGSVAELSCQKIIFDLQLADLPVQKIDLGVIAGSLRRRTTLEDACRTVQQLLLPCPLHVLLPRYPRFLGAGLHLIHLSHFRGPAHWARYLDEPYRENAPR